MRQRYLGKFAGFSENMLGKRLPTTTSPAVQHHRRADVTRKSQLEPQLTKFSAQMTETALGGADPPA